MLYELLKGSWCPLPSCTWHPILLYSVSFKIYNLPNQPGSMAITVNKKLLAAAKSCQLQPNFLEMSHK